MSFGARLRECLWRVFGDVFGDVFGVFGSFCLEMCLAMRLAVFGTVFWRRAGGSLESVFGGCFRGKLGECVSGVWFGSFLLGNVFGVGLWGYFWGMLGGSFFGKMSPGVSVGGVVLGKLLHICSVRRWGSGDVCGEVFGDELGMR